MARLLEALLLRRTLRWFVRMPPVEAAETLASTTGEDATELRAPGQVWIGRASGDTFELELADSDGWRPRVAGRLEPGRSGVFVDVRMRPHAGPLAMILAGLAYGTLAGTGTIGAGEAPGLAIGFAITCFVAFWAIPLWCFHRAADESVAQLQAQLPPLMELPAAGPYRDPAA